MKTDLFISCPCGSKAAIVETSWGYYAHCLSCGRLSFWRSALLTEKVRSGSKFLCPHEVGLKDCKGGKTSWCKICRMRTFVPQME